MQHRDLLGLVADRYPAVAKDILRPLVELGRLSRRCCGGDIEKFLVILVIAIRTSEHRDFAAAAPETLQNGDLPVLPGLGTNVRSIAASLDMPRETVRRKVTELLDARWLVRTPDHNLYFTALAYCELGPVRVQIEHLAVRCYEIVSLLRAQDEGAGAPVEPRSVTASRAV